jgi:hypothetical protein
MAGSGAAGANGTAHRRLAVKGLPPPSLGRRSRPLIIHEYGAKRFPPLRRAITSRKIARAATGRSAQLYRDAPAANFCCCIDAGCQRASLF